MRSQRQQFGAFEVSGGYNDDRNLTRRAVEAMTRSHRARESDEDKAEREASERGEQWFRERVNAASSSHTGDLGPALASDKAARRGERLRHQGVVTGNGSDESDPLPNERPSTAGKDAWLRTVAAQGEDADAPHIDPADYGLTPEYD